MRKKANFLEWNNNILLASIKKINFNIILIIILDALFYLLSGYLAVFWFQRLQSKMSSVALPSDIVAIGHERAQQMLDDIRIFFYLAIFSFVLLLVVIIFFASILKGIIWAKTTGTKITARLLSRFLALNLIWMGFWFVLIVLMSLIVQPYSIGNFLIIAIILAIYSTNAIYAIFMKKQTISSIKEGMLLSIKKVHLFLLPYTLFFSLYLIIVFASYALGLPNIILAALLKISSFIGISQEVVASNAFLLPVFGFIAFLINPLFLLFIAFFRYYFSTLVDELKE